MSIRVMNQVWEHSSAVGTALLVLLALADRADEQGYCWPSVDYIAQKARVSKRQAQYLLRELEESGEITTDKRAGRGKTNLYQVVSKGDKAHPTAPIENKNGEVQRREKVQYSVRKGAIQRERMQSTAHDSSLKDSPIKPYAIDSSSSTDKKTYQVPEEEEFSEFELAELTKIGVYPELIPEIQRIVVEKDISEQVLLELIQNVQQQDREGTPGALLVNRLRRWKPPKKKTERDWLEI